MNNKFIGLGVNLTLALILFAVPDAAHAATDCYGDLNADTPPLPGEYIVCMLGNIWSTAQWIFVVIAVVMVTLLIYKTITNRENSKVLETLPSQWMYLIIFFFLAFGAGGILLNFLFRFFGFGSLDTWIEPIEKILTSWDDLVK